MAWPLFSYLLLLAVGEVVSRTGAEGRPQQDTGLALVQSQRMVVQGYEANATGGVTLISGPLPDVYACLEECRASWQHSGPRCRMVSFNVESCLCRLLTKAAFSTSFAFSRNEDVVVAGYSDKQFHHVPSHVYVHAQRTSASVAVPAANTCQHLCHLHPICDYAQYLKQINGASNMLCTLMKLTPAAYPGTNTAYDAFVL